MGKSMEVRFERLVEFIDTLVEGEEKTAKSSLVSTQKLISHSIHLQYVKQLCDMLGVERQGNWI